MEFRLQEDELNGRQRPRIGVSLSEIVRLLRHLPCTGLMRIVSTASRSDQLVIGRRYLRRPGEE
jgi:hypothetical protein